MIMLKVDDEIIVIGGCPHSGCVGTVVKITNQKALVEFEKYPNEKFWFRLTNVKSLTEVIKKEAPPRDLYKIQASCAEDEFYCRLTKDQVHFLHYLYEQDVIFNYDKIDDFSIDEP